MAQASVISVIIPCYNSPDLSMTLDSLIMQDYPAIQPVLVDDGSKNFSREETLRYLTEGNRGNLVQIRVLENPENRGTVYTMNRGLKECQGKIIFNLACDDVFYDEKVLSDWVAAFEKTGAPVMTAYRQVCNQDLSELLSVEPTASQVKSIQNKSPEALFEELAKTNYVFGSCTARTAESIRAYGAYDESYRLIEDHPMNLRLLRQGVPMAFFDRVVVKCRTGGTSCAENYNEAYAADVDRILHQEVLPYTKHPTAMKWAYFQWKRDQRLLRKRAILAKKMGQTAADLWYYAHHPIRTVMKIPSKLFAKKGE